MWDQQDGESAKAWAAFIVYRGMGPSRTLRAAAAAAAELSPSLNTWKGWANRGAWRARAAAWDAAADRQGWRTTRWTIDRSGSKTGARCWTEPARTRERAPVSAATEYDAAFRNDAGGYFLPADASSPAFGRKRSRAVSKIIRCVRNSRARLSSRWPRSSSRPACPRRLGQASRSLRSISKGPSFGTGRDLLFCGSQPNWPSASVLIE